MPNWCCLYCYPQRHLLSHIFHFTLNSQTCKMSSAHTFALGHISCYPSVLRVSHSLMQHAICATCVADESINYLRTESACTGWLTFRQTATRRSYLCKEHRSHRAVTSRVTWQLKLNTMHIFYSVHLNCLYSPVRVHQMQVKYYKSKEGCCGPYEVIARSWRIFSPLIKLWAVFTAFLKMWKFIKRCNDIYILCATYRYINCCKRNVSLEKTNWYCSEPPH